MKKIILIFLCLFCIQTTCISQIKLETNLKIKQNELQIKKDNLKPKQEKFDSLILKIKNEYSKNKELHNANKKYELESERLENKKKKIQKILDKEKSYCEYIYDSQPFFVNLQYHYANNTTFKKNNCYKVGIANHTSQLQILEQLRHGALISVYLQYGSNRVFYARNFFNTSNSESIPRNTIFKFIDKTYNYTTIQGIRQNVLFFDTIKATPKVTKLKSDLDKLQSNINSLQSKIISQQQVLESNLEYKSLQKEIWELEKIIIELETTTTGMKEYLLRSMKPLKINRILLSNNSIIQGIIVKISSKDIKILTKKGYRIILKKDILYCNDSKGAPCSL